MAWQVQYKDGVYLPQTGWWLDARWPVERSFVSHAHFDHMAKHREVIFAPGTAHLMRTRLPAKAGARLEHELPFGRTERRMDVPAVVAALAALPQPLNLPE